MKEYPSILSSNGANHAEFTAYVFDKVDGSNLRFEWNKKSGWYKFGTRTRLFDQSDEVFGQAIPLFLNGMALPLTQIISDNRWNHAIVYVEFWGKNSFAGVHIKEDEKFLSLFDIAVDKKGLLSPREFLKEFVSNDKILTPNYLGQHNWTRGFVERVKTGSIEEGVKLGDSYGITYEGVVGKSGSGHKLIMRKAKTQVWLDAVKGKYGEEAEKYI